MSDSSTPRLSVCMIVRDEADCLPTCLASLAAPVDEVVVADTGSRDATPELARRAGARVISVPWNDDFAAARNAVLEAARGRFCLMLDADEVVEAGTWPLLAAFLEADECDFGLISIASESPDGLVREAIKRVCRNDGRARYVGRIHEQLEGSGRTGDTGLVCRHGGYNEEAIAGKGKIERNVRLLRLALEEQPDDAYLHYQLGRSLSLQPGREHIDEALEQLTRAVQDAPEAEPYRAAAARDLGYLLHEKGFERKALHLVCEFRELHPRFTDLAFLEGLLRLALGDRDGMLRAFESCLELGEPRGFTSVEGVGSYRAHHNLGLYRELSGQRARAREHYRAALELAPGFVPSRERLTGLENRSAPRKRRSAGARTSG